MLFKEKFIPRVRISNVKEINITADNLVKNLLDLSKTEVIGFLDSCGVNHLDSHLLIAGIKPLEVFEITNKNVNQTLFEFDKILSANKASIFTLSYDFGLKLEKIKSRKKEFNQNPEPDIFIATFDNLIIHDYNLNKTYLQGNKENFEDIIEFVSKNTNNNFNSHQTQKAQIVSNFTKEEYIKKIEIIQEYIRKGDTYQTNLTQQFVAELSKDMSPQEIFWNLRKNHPAPFASFLSRINDFVISISPERFVQVKSREMLRRNESPAIIRTSPIKGTRPRGENTEADQKLRNELLNSKKDLAENTMIVDLLRNDIGRICEYGSVNVVKLCDLEEHPSLFHLVSTISGTLKKNTNFAEIIKAIFPCGSITGCPKIQTMKIIDELETANRGLSMGAIGYCGFDGSFDLNVAIRTMVVKEKKAIFNVGGGIVIDSDPLDEYEESLIKAKAIFNSIGINKF